ncbi:MAG TPA: VCBS repeat-containing protein [Pyrinomonadaceae bacterium]
MKRERFIQAIFIFLTLLGGANVYAAPANDDYQNAVVTTLSAPLLEFQGSTFGATKEPGEPNHARNAGGNSVWYRIVPQETAVLRIYINATSAANYFNTLLAVYKGTTPSDFNLVAENDDMGYTTMSEVTLTVKPGNMYYVAVDGYNNDGNIATGNFRIRFEKLGVPMNDTPDIGPHMRFPSTERGFAAGTNRNATKDADEPNLTVNAGGKSVWFAWTAPQSRAMKVTVSCNSFVQDCFEMQLGVFRGGLDNKIGSNDNFDHNSDVSSVSFFAEEGVTYGFGIDGIRFLNGSVSEGNFFIEFSPSEYRYDTNFDASDNRADVSVFRPSDGTWYSLPSSTNQMNAVQFGQSGDVPVPADYDGDAVTDYAVARNTPQGKFWYFLYSASNSFQAISYGLPEDKPLVGDYDGDGRADMVAVRPTAQNLVWYIRNSSAPNNAVDAHVFGLSTDQPVVGNFVKGFDTIGGLFAADLAVVRADPATGKKTWYLQSTTGVNYRQMQFGLASDVNVPADYDRDGYTDLAVWRPSNGTWYIFNESANNLKIKQWGMNGDIPMPAQFDDAGAPELAVFRPSTGVWWIYKNAGSSSTYAINWGISGDKPASALTPLMNP